MDKKIDSFHVIDLPAERRDMPSFNELNARKYFMYALLEVDVTHARQFIEAHKAQTGESLSFTGYLAFCMAQAVDEHKAVQAYLKGRRQLVIFDNVDVGIMVEQKTGEKQTLMGYVIKAANHKTFREIHKEIRAIQSKPVTSRTGREAWLRSLMALPWPLSWLFNNLLFTLVRRDPTIFTSMAGTVGISAVGMFGKGQGGWGLVPVIHGLGLIVGGIAWKPAVVAGKIEPRQILNLTVAFDHDVIDGAPATRFTRRLVELIESGYGLNENQTQTVRDGEPAALQAEITPA